MALLELRRCQLLATRCCMPVRSQGNRLQQRSGQPRTSVGSLHRPADFRWTYSYDTKASMARFSACPNSTSRTALSPAAMRPVLASHKPPARGTVVTGLRRNPPCKSVFQVVQGLGGWGRHTHRRGHRRRPDRVHDLRLRPRPPAEEKSKLQSTPFA